MDFHISSVASISLQEVNLKPLIPTPNYTSVSSEDALVRAVVKCRKEGPTALDFETTSLAPKDGRVRLVSLCNDKCHYLVDFDKIPGGFRAVAKLFEGGSWISFNAGFENRWFYDAGSKVDTRAYVETKLAREDYLIQRAGKPIMALDDFLRGNAIAAGSQL